MRILYGLASEGMGHAIRSKVVLDWLGGSHEVMVVCGGRPYQVLSGQFENVHEIVGTGIAYDGNGLAFWRTIGVNVKRAPKAIPQNAKVLWKAIGGFKPDLVITDFESLVSFYADISGRRLVSVDNMQIADKCKVERPAEEALAFEGTRRLIHDRVPRADQYVITTFFDAPIRKRYRDRVFLVPPILREMILEAPRSRGEHVVVYQTSDANVDLASILKGVDAPFVIYGFNEDRRDGNLTFRTFSEAGFVEDLATSRALLANGGFTTLGEAVYLHKPILSVPIGHHTEQILNAFYVAKLGYGEHARELTREGVEGFLSRLDTYAGNLAAYGQDGNTVLFERLGELLGEGDG